MLEDEFEKKFSEDYTTHKHKSLGRGLGALMGDDDYENIFDEIDTINSNDYIFYICT